MYLAVYMLDSEVNNGGFSQFFFNSSGNHWQEAMNGLKSFGMVERAAMFQKVLDLFEANGPSTDRSVRQTELSNAFRKYEKEFSKFDSGYYKLQENVEVMSLRFVIQNAAKFR
jgi:hypothetical protein